MDFNINVGDFIARLNQADRDGVTYQFVRAESDGNIAVLRLQSDDWVGPGLSIVVKAEGLIEFYLEDVISGRN